MTQPAARLASDQGCCRSAAARRRPRLAVSSRAIPRDRAQRAATMNREIATAAGDERPQEDRPAGGAGDVGCAVGRHPWRNPRRPSRPSRRERPHPRPNFGRRHREAGGRARGSRERPWRGLLRDQGPARAELCLVKTHAVQQDLDPVPGQADLAERLIQVAAVARCPAFVQVSSAATGLVQGGDRPVSVVSRAPPPGQCPDCLPGRCSGSRAERRRGPAPHAGRSRSR